MKSFNDESENVTSPITSTPTPLYTGPNFTSMTRNLQKNELRIDKSINELKLMNSAAHDNQTLSSLPGNAINDSNSLSHTMISNQRSNIDNSRSSTKITPIIIDSSPTKMTFLQRIANVIPPSSREQVHELPTSQNALSPVRLTTLTTPNHQDNHFITANNTKNATILKPENNLVNNKSNSIVPYPIEIMNEFNHLKERIIALEKTNNELMKEKEFIEFQAIDAKQKADNLVASLRGIVVFCFISQKLDVVIYVNDIWCIEYIVLMISLVANLKDSKV